MTLAGRVALVTGGTGALGQAVTRQLLADGATVCVPWVVEEEHRRLLAAVRPAEAARLFPERCDVTDETALARLLGAARARHGAMSVLVTLVGGFAGGRLVETERATWDRMLALNLTSAYTAARAVVPEMIAARHGRVVTVGARAVVPATGGFIAYTVSKSGVIAFTQALAQELRGTGVTANCVLPSTMDTPGNRAAMPDADRSGWVRVESVADAIAFLVRDESADVNGTLVAI